MQSRAAESFELAFFVANEMDSLLFIALVYFLLFTWYHRALVVNIQVYRNFIVAVDVFNYFSYTCNYIYYFNHFYKSAE